MRWIDSVSAWKLHDESCKARPIWWMLAVLTEQQRQSKRLAEAHYTRRQYRSGLSVTPSPSPHPPPPDCEHTGQLAWSQPVLWILVKSVSVKDHHWEAHVQGVLQIHGPGKTICTVWLSFLTPPTLTALLNLSLSVITSTSHKGSQFRKF